MCSTRPNSSASRTRFSAEEVCRELIEKANSRGTADNLTVAFLKMIGPTPNVAPEASSGIVARLMGLFAGASETPGARSGLQRFDRSGALVLTCAPVRHTSGAA